jgi:iron(III) transport system ATP-binding protein
MRHVFLGNSRDYLLALADGTQLRVVTSPEESIAEGNKVWLTLPPNRCRVLVS